MNTKSSMFRDGMQNAFALALFIDPLYLKMRFYIEGAITSNSMDEGMLSSGMHMGIKLLSESGANQS